MPSSPRRTRSALLKSLTVLASIAAACAFSTPAFAAAGDLYVTDLATNSILVYAPDGTHTTFATGFHSPQGLAFDSSGNLFAADMATGTIFKFTADGTASAFATGLQAPAGLTFSAFGNLLVAENAANRVDKFKPDRTKSVVLALSAPYGMAFDNPSLFVSNHTSTMKVTSLGQSASPVSSGDSSRGVAVDADDNVYISSDFGAIFKVTESGTKTTFASGLSAPSGMAFDRLPDSGNLFVADRLGGGHIYKFTELGVRTTFASGGSPNFLAFEPALAGKLLNISTRGRVLTGENVLIGGFIVTGTTPKRVIIRGMGPTLASFNVAGVLSDPVLELHYPNGSVVTNNNWKSTQAAEIQATHFEPNNDLESAIVATLAPGAYTAIVRGNNGQTGVALVEVYDLDPAGTSQMDNISTRGFVDRGDNVMIAGFIIGSPNNDSGKVLVRAIGPTLSQFSIASPLQDPTLELHNANGAVIAFNDNWRDAHAPAIQRTALPPTDLRESAILANLTPGSYTAIVRGKNNTTGVALVEVYRVK